MVQENVTKVSNVLSYSRESDNVPDQIYNIFLKQSTSAKDAHGRKYFIDLYGRVQIYGIKKKEGGKVVKLS